MRRVLIANRGEIALRAVRACRKLGLESLAVYSSADANSPHRWAADHAVCIGPPPPKASYLNAAALIETAVASKCDAVYPGYGFLAENTAFAERCAEADLVFVGPGAESISQMGDKVAAREGRAAKLLFSKYKEFLQKYDPPAWLRLDAAKLEGEVLAVPADVEMPFEINLLIESFSK